jgi:hypothetical protein
LVSTSARSSPKWKPFEWILITHDLSSYRYDDYCQQNQTFPILGSGKETTMTKEVL